jgi:hypothetical protein
MDTNNTTTTTPGVTFVSLPTTSTLNGPGRLTRTPPSAVTGILAIDSLSFDEMRARPDLQFDNHLRAAYYQRLRALTHERAQVRTDELIRNRTMKRKGKAQRRSEQRGKSIHTESAVLGEMSDGSASVTEVHENVTDHSGEVPDNTSAGVSQLDSKDGARQQHSLDEFFLRPVTIYDSTWNSGTYYNVPLKVWDLWSLDASVRAKLSNYAYFKGTMKIKISVSGTPFHYGTLMASYQPYAMYNDNLTAFDGILASLTPGATLSVKECYNNYLSQAPGVAYVDVKENQPVVLTLPFISHKQMFRLYNEAGTAIVNATSFNDFEEAGELRLVTLNPFLIANDDYDTHVSLNVYAWVEDIQLGCITGTNIDITAESKTLGQRFIASLERGGTEYEHPGPVTIAATTVEKISNILADIPVIGPFAKATSTISRSVGKVASWFGWSKPVVLEKPCFVKNNPFANGANLAGNDTAFRITCDPKQELTVDQTIGGVDGPDDMAINSISARETFLTTFEWLDTAIAMDTVLWRALVTPTQYSIAGLTNGVAALIQPTTTDFVSRPFQYWRGTMKYRFEIVCSKFHRGKLLFKFEPNCAQAILISSNETKLNQQNTVIVDIQDTQDICFSFDWAFPRAWAQIQHELANLTPNATNAYEDLALATVAVRGPFANGFVEVIPLNELVQPTAGSGVKINVYVSCEDLQLAYPTGEGLLGGAEDTSRRYNYTESKDVTHDTINANDSTLDGIHDYHFGERVLSLRSLLKRYQTVTTQSSTTTTNGAVLWALNGNSIPWNASPVRKGTIASEPSNPGEFRNNLYNYMRPAYMGMRGGFRFRVVPMTGGLMGPATYTKVTMSELLDSGVNQTSIGNMSAVANGALTSNRSRNEGTIIFHPASNGGVEFEIPFYSPSLFLFAFAYDYGSSYSADPAMGYDSYTNAKWTARFVIDHSSASAYGNKGGTVFMVDAIPAEDFTFLRFQGAPPICIAP